MCPRTRLVLFPVLIQRGHFNAERMSPDKQLLYVDLVTAGFIVLAFDPTDVHGEFVNHAATGV